MSKIQKQQILILGLLVFLFSMNVEAQKFKVSYTTDAYEGPFTGKVILYLSKYGKTPKDLNYGMPLFCVFSTTVNNVKPNATILIDDSAIAYPVKLSDIERGEYYAQAVWDRNNGGRNIGNSQDNMYNEPIKINLTKNFDETFSINCSSKIPVPKFEETDYVKELKAPSTLLSSFYKKDMTIDAAIILPAEYYSEPTRMFPVLYKVSGFGGDYHSYSGKDAKSSPIDSIHCITVFLDGNCPTGHSTYANSANNGPWGDALVNELIPLIEKNFRCNGARFLTGHSSGGWTVAWLQVNYPKVFAGCWSSAPDPVDFRNFQLVNIYDDKNMYYDEEDNIRMDGTIAGRIPWVYLKDDYLIENVLYRGEQYQSWNAVFGDMTKDGVPESICNVNTGDIDPVVVSHWKNYDISLILRNHWEELKPDLDSKIRFSVGTDDNFFLDKSVILLEQEMNKLNSNFEFAYYPGDHFTVGFETYYKDGYQFLAKRYAEWLIQQP